VQQSHQVQLAQPQPTYMTPNMYLLTLVYTLTTKTSFQILEEYASRHVQRTRTGLPVDYRTQLAKCEEVCFSGRRGMRTQKKHCGVPSLACKVREKCAAWAESERAPQRPRWWRRARRRWLRGRSREAAPAAPCATCASSGSTASGVYATAPSPASLGCAPGNPPAGTCAHLPCYRVTARFKMHDMISGLRTGKPTCGHLHLHAAAALHSDVVCHNLDMISELGAGKTPCKPLQAPATFHCKVLCRHLHMFWHSVECSHMCASDIIDGCTPV
jgi:hypothetical protein